MIIFDLTILSIELYIILLWYFCFFKNKQHLLHFIKTKILLDVLPLIHKNIHYDSFIAMWIRPVTKIIIYKCKHNALYIVCKTCRRVIRLWNIWNPGALPRKKKQIKYLKKNNRSPSANNNTLGYENIRDGKKIPDVKHNIVLACKNICIRAYLYNNSI